MISMTEAPKHYMQELTFKWPHRLIKILVGKKKWGGELFQEKELNM